MSTLKQRIRRRAVPVGIVTAIIGYTLLSAYLEVARVYTDAEAVQSDGPGLRGPLIFGLVGFAMMAAIECARREPK